MTTYRMPAWSQFRGQLITMVPSWYLAMALRSLNDPDAAEHVATLEAARQELVRRGELVLPSPPVTSGDARSKRGRRAAA